MTSKIDEIIKFLEGIDLFDGTKSSVQMQKQLTQNIKNLKTRYAKNINLAFDEGEKFGREQQRQTTERCNKVTGQHKPDLKVVNISEDIKLPINSLHDGILDVIDQYVGDREKVTVAEVIGTLQIIQMDLYKELKLDKAFLSIEP